MSYFLVFCIYLMLLNVSVCNAGSNPGVLNTSPQQVHGVAAHQSSRKMLGKGMCTNRDISISQSRDSASGIPQYIVQIVNSCMSGCAPTNIHLHCGWFASARIVNPRTFKRISYDDCLVNGGRPLRSTQIISFTYSNSFMYPLGFKSARFC